MIVAITGEELYRARHPNLTHTPQHPRCLYRRHLRRHHLVVRTRHPYLRRRRRQFSLRRTPQQCPCSHLQRRTLLLPTLAVAARIATTHAPPLRPRLQRVTSYRPSQRSSQGNREVASIVPILARRRNMGEGKDLVASPSPRYMRTTDTSDPDDYFRMFSMEWCTFPSHVSAAFLWCQSGLYYLWSRHPYTTNFLGLLVLRINRNFCIA